MRVHFSVFAKSAYLALLLRIFYAILATPRNLNESTFCTHKKAGLQSCCSANSGSGIASIPNKQHRSPRRMYIIYKVRDMRTRCIYTPEDILVSQCFGIYEFTRFELAKTKRLRRLLNMSCTPSHAKEHTPSAWADTAKLLFCAAKLHKKNDIRKRYVIFLCFFSVFSRWMLNHPLAKSKLWMEFYCFNTGIQASIAGVYDHTETPYCQQGYTNRANRLFVHNPCLLRRLLSCISHLL